jgi:PAS domain S-box-containing protein
MAARGRSTSTSGTHRTNGNGAHPPLPTTSRTRTRVSGAWDRLAAGEEQFRVLLEFASDAIAVIDEEGTIVYASQTTTRILGYSIEEFVGKSAFDLVHPDDLERTQSLFAECLRSPGLPIRAEYRARHKDGTWRELEGVGVNRVDHPGVRGIAISYRDVSERKQTQEAILHLASIVETSGNAIIGLDADGRIESWNSSAERLYGYVPSEVLGRSLEIVFPQERSRDSADLVKQVRDGTGVANCESIGLRKNGERVPISVTISPIRNISAGVTGASAIVWDVSERKRAEVELQRAKEAAEEYFHYFNGRNPLSMVYLTNTGSIGAERSAPPPRPSDELAIEPAPANGGPYRSVLLAVFAEQGAPPPGLQSASGLIAVNLPESSRLTTLFKPGVQYRFSSDKYDASYRVLEAYPTSQEALLVYPEGLPVDAAKGDYLHWREFKDPTSADSTAWTELK